MPVFNRLSSGRQRKEKDLKDSTKTTQKILSVYISVRNIQTVLFCSVLKVKRLKYSLVFKQFSY